MQDWGKRLLEIQESLQSIQARMTGDAAGGASRDAAGDDEDDGIAGAAGA